MKRDEIISTVKKLYLPDGQYAVFGSGLLGVYGLREINDIDIVVLPELYKKIKQEPGWREFLKDDGNWCLQKDDYEILASYNIGKYQPKIEDLIIMAIKVRGISFVPLSEVLKWKSTNPRPKDLADIKLIKGYISNHAG